MSNGAPARPSLRPAFFALLYVAPVILILLTRVLPLAAGTRTLYLRDVFGTHLEMKAAQADAMRSGLLPLIDPYRAGGQPALGNPDSVPLYPDNLLYLIAPPLWALNAHFWIHLLLAPFAMYWLGRAWGLRREAAWAAATFYALGGYLLSHMMLYNQIAGVALAPALAAACLSFAEGRSRRLSGAAVAVVWALLLLGGEPFMGFVALVLAVGSVLARRAARPGALPRIGLLLICGTLIAAPQIVELSRIVGWSYRGHLGYSPDTRTAASWDPRQIVEWLLPMAFGRPDRIGASGFWGYRFFTDRPPYYFSLYPGLLALAFAAAGLRGGDRSVRAPVAAVAAGLFLSLGRFNPAAAWLFESGAGLVRYPVRMWLPVAVGGALLAGIGFERCIFDNNQRMRRALYLILSALLGLFLLVSAALVLLSGRAASWLAGLMPAGLPSGTAAAAIGRWSDLSLISIGALAIFLPATALASRFPKEGGAFLVALHAAGQMVLLAPLLSADTTAPYRTTQAMVEAIPPKAPVAHGGSEGLFGKPGEAPHRYPGEEAFWFARRVFHEAYPCAGVLRGRAYELNVSSEGLDAFLSTAARDAVRLADDATRVRLLAAWGVEYFLLDRPLDPPARDRVEPVLSLPSYGGSIDLYRIPAAAPALLLAGTIVRAPNLNDALRRLVDPAFDPRTMVVLPGPPEPGSGPAGGASRPAAAGTARLLAEGPESLSAEVEAKTPGILVIQRSFLPLYRATVDGVPVSLRVANLHRIGLPVPAGRHRVDLWADRRPLRASSVVSILGLFGVAVLVLRTHREGNEIRVEPERDRRP